MRLQMPPAGKTRFSRRKGTHEARATSKPTGASSGAASSSSGQKRVRVPKPPAAPIASRSIVQLALDRAAAKSLADHRASLAASRRERAARRAGADDGTSTPPPMASRDPSTEMSSGGSGPVQKRQVTEASMFDGVDMEEEEEASSEETRVEQALSSALASSLQRLRPTQVTRRAPTNLPLHRQSRSRPARHRCRCRRWAWRRRWARWPPRQRRPRRMNRRGPSQEPRA